MEIKHTKNQLEILRYLNFIYNQKEPIKIGLTHLSSGFKIKNITSLNAFLVKERLVLNKGNKMNPLFVWDTIKPNINMVALLEDKCIVQARIRQRNNTIKKFGSRKNLVTITRQSVHKFFKDNNQSEDLADKFIKYYSANNWTQKNGNKVKNWKLVAKNNWFKNAEKTNTETTLEMPDEFWADIKPEVKTKEESSNFIETISEITALNGRLNTEIRKLKENQGMIIEE